MSQNCAYSIAPNLKKGAFKFLTTSEAKLKYCLRSGAYLGGGIGPWLSLKFSPIFCPKLRAEQKKGLHSNLVQFFAQI